MKIPAEIVKSLTAAMNFLTEWDNNKLLTADSILRCCPKC
jgi:hypothetical protein